MSVLDDADAILAELRKLVYAAGRDRPNVEALAQAGMIVLAAHAREHGRDGSGPEHGNETVAAPRWLVTELVRTLLRLLADEGALRPSEANRPDSKRARGRPRDEDRRPLEGALALAEHFRRWEAVRLRRARGETLEEACAMVAEELGIACETVTKSYRKIESLRRR